MQPWIRFKRSDATIVDVNAKGETLTSPSQIYNLLKRAFDAHCLLKVQLERNGGTYSSAILKIGTNRQYLILDALTPAGGNAQLTPPAEISVSTLFNRVDLSFSSKVVKIDNAEKLPRNFIALPKQVYYGQRRQEHRVAVPMNWPATVSIRIDAGHSISGIVRDLSPSGFRAQFDGPLPSSLGQQPRPLQFTLGLVQDSLIEGELEIRHVYVPKIGKLRQIGTHILAITPQHQRMLEQWVAEIDRQQSRRR